MGWLRRHAWWLLLLLSITLIYFGVTDLIVGAPADPGIATGLSGMTLEELQSEGEAAYRLFDFYTRMNGWSMLAFGLVATCVLVLAYRRNQRWAWWTMWTLPAWAAGVFVFFLVAGTDPTQPPPPPMISGPIFALVAAAAQLVSGPRFFRAA